MIKIIKGSYGLKRGSMVVPIHAGSDPIELSKEKEERLVRLGVAEYVNADPDEVKKPADGTDDAQDEIVDEFPEYSESMKIADLKKIAEIYGVDTSSMRSKKEVVEAIDAARDELPDFDAADSVE